MSGRYNMMGPYLVAALCYLQVHAVLSLCTVPDAPENGNIQPAPGSRIPTSAIVRYTCDAGHHMDLADDYYYMYYYYSDEEKYDEDREYKVTTFQRRCQENGELDRWDVLSCTELILCTVPDAPENGNIQPAPGSRIPVGTHVTYTCDAGHYMEDRMTTFERSCKENGELDQQHVSSCTEFTCTEEAPKNGRLVPNDMQVFRAGQGVRIECDEGYGLVGLRAKTCEMFRGWEPAGTTMCQNIYCPKPKLENGGYEPNGNLFYPGDKIEFFCLNDKQLAGTRGMECTMHYGWNSTDIPVCLPLYRQHGDSPCLEPGMSPGASLLVKERNYRKYICDDNLHMVGAEEIWCNTTTGHWSQRPPYCRTKFCFDTIPELSYKIRRKMKELTTENEIDSSSRHKRAFSDVREPGKPLTLYFVIDQSGSIKQGDFNNTILFMKELISRLKIRELNDAGLDTVDGARIGLVGFAANANNHFLPYEDKINATVMNKRIDNDVKHLANSTNINRGLQNVIDAIEAGNKRNNSYWQLHLKESNKAIIIITDGIYTEGGSPDKAAKKLREELGYSIYAIGVTETTDSKELLNLVDPEKKYDDIYYLRNHTSYLHLVEAMLGDDYDFADCGINDVKPCNKTNYHIRGGKITTVQQFPWHVDIYWKKNADEKQISDIKKGLKAIGGNPLGHGALIGRRWVLTAAHNFHDKNTASDKSEFILEFGNGERHTVKQMFSGGYEYNETYKAGKNDIMLLLLDSAVNLARDAMPICLPKPIKAFGQNFTANLTDAYKIEEVGYIVGRAGGVQLKAACAPIRGCEYNSETHPRITDPAGDPLFCAGVTGPKDDSGILDTEPKNDTDIVIVDTEKGDSGSAFMMKLPNQDEALDTRYVAIGLTSFDAMPSGQSDHTGLGAYVNVTYWMDWIKEEITRNSIKNPN